MTFGSLPRQFSSKAAITLLAVLLCVGLASAQQNLVYVNANISVSGQNAVLAFVNDGAGNLTPVAGSPFLTGGTGVSAAGSGAQIDNDGEIIINPEGTLLFAVNGNSNNVAVFKIQSDGSLVAVAGSPFASGGIQPASLAFANNVFGANNSRVIVVNQAADPNQGSNVPNYVSFSVSPQGVMKQGSAFAMPAGSAPAQAIIRPGSPEFFGIEFMNGTVSSYKFSKLGAISKINSVTPAGPAPVTVGAAKNPAANGLYVALPAQNQLVVIPFSGASGALSNGPEFGVPGSTPCWVFVNPAGTVMYDAETPSGAITVWSLANSKSPAQLQHLKVQGTTPLPTNMATDPTGQFLYAVDRSAVLHVLNVASDGTLSENISPLNLGLPAGTVPLGVVTLSK
jgi:6-phosphogluconolactonase (cycloisomerase 2 family)